LFTSQYYNLHDKNRYVTTKEFVKEIWICFAVKTSNIAHMNEFGLTSSQLYVKLSLGFQNEPNVSSFKTTKPDWVQLLRIPNKLKQE